jgi:hypothetical protein
MSPLATDRFTARQHHVLNAWRDVLDDIRHLCESLNALPDDCSCGDGRAHLAGRCACCQRTHEQPGSPKCEDCEDLLAKLRPVVTQLTVDTWQFFPSALDFLDLRDRQKGQASMGTPTRERHLAIVAREAAVDTVARHISAVIGTFERLVAAVDEFRAGCGVSQLRALKAAATELLSEIQKLDGVL